MNTNFFLTIIIGVIFWAAICFLFYLSSKWVILKFQSFIKGMIKEIEPTRDDMTDREYNELLMRELRKPMGSVDLGSGKDYSVETTVRDGETVAFRIIDDPTKIKSNDIIFMQ